MTRQQKLILVVLGILDIAVIALLGSAVIRSLPPATPTVSPIALQASPCAQRMIETFTAMPPFDGGVPTVAWDAHQLSLALDAGYTTPAPPKDSAQLLWTALDGIATSLQAGCTLPETVTVTVIAHGTVETHRFLAQLRGADVESWLAGDLSDVALAATARYRETAQTVSP